MGYKTNLSLKQFLESIKWQAKWFQETVHRIVANQDEMFSMHKQIQWIDSFQATAMRQCEISDNRSNDVHVLNFALEDLIWVDHITKEKKVKDSSEEKSRADLSEETIEDSTKDHASGDLSTKISASDGSPPFHQ